MDFFAQQENARRRTWVLVFYLGLAIFCMIATVYLAIAGLLFFADLKKEKPRYAEHPDGYAEVASPSLWNPGLLILVGMGVPMVVGGGSLFKSMQLASGGGKSVATMLGGKRVSANTTDPRERQLLNVVEEMAIASGMPAPSVYILEDEATINAFAAGYTTDDAVIGVNRGALNYLTRDELQGVVAHEFSHILNGDMRFNIRLIAILFGILMLATIGFWVFRMAAYSGGGSSRGNKKNGVPLIVIGLILVVVGYSGLFFARLIKAAISRQREYLADASAVQFTRNPDGIAGALKKIGGLSAGGKVASPEAESASHLFFASALGGSWNSWWSTHPPLVKRIQAIDPSFDGKFPPTQMLAPDPPKTSTDSKPSSKNPFQNFPTPMGQAMPMPMPIDPTIVVASLANPTEDGLQSAQEFIHNMPAELYEALHDVYSARFVVFSLLLDDDAEIRSKQLAMISEYESAGAAETEKYARLVESMGREGRLPIIEIVQSSLVEMSSSQFERFSATVDQLIQADNRVSLFEFILKRLVVEHLARRIGKSPPPRIRYTSITGVQRHIEVVLSLLARIGHDTEAEVQGGFAAGMQEIDDTRTQLLPMKECGLKPMEEAFNVLFESTPAIKKRTLHAAYACIAYDGVVTVNEAELFRAISDALGVPSPPIQVGAIEE